MNGRVTRALLNLGLQAAFIACGCAVAAEDSLERLVLPGEPEREAFLWQPEPGFRPKRLVLMLHGAGGDVARIRHFTARGLERVAQEGRWVVVYPLGVAGTWNDCRREADYPARRMNADDVGYLAALIEMLLERYALSGPDVVVAGFSNGAQMALRLALERPELLGGLVMVAAQLPAPAASLCPAAIPALNLLHIVGSADPLVPYAGGPSRGADGGPLGELHSATETALAFVAAAGGAIDARAPGLGARDRQVLLFEWRTQRSLVRQHVLAGAGHVVPQEAVVFPPFLGPSSAAIDFGRAVLEFVAQLEDYTRSP
jgi:polyhydroxybutyrate depolymerase